MSETEPAAPPVVPGSPWRWRLALLGVALLGALALGWTGRRFVARLLPIAHTGVVKRVGTVAGLGNPPGGFTYVVLFEDGFVCESTVPTFAAVRERDTIHLRGYHDVAGWPVLDPGWWRCVDAQLVSVDQVP